MFKRISFPAPVRRAATVAALTLTTAIVVVPLAYGHFHGELIDIESSGGGGGEKRQNMTHHTGIAGLRRDVTYQPGSGLDLELTLTGGPETVTVYSDPIGAVSYHGTVADSEATVTATTSSDTPAGPVTVYASTDDGTNIVSTTVLAQ